MKDNRLIIQINSAARDIFAFTLNPANTPLWIDSIVKEEINETPTRLGSIYRNMNKSGKWSEYIITAFERDRMFEMTSKDGNYHVKYTFKILDNNLTEVEYYEWVDSGNLEEPFKLEFLEKLKELVNI